MSFALDMQVTSQQDMIDPITVLAPDPDDIIDIETLMY